MGTIVITGSAGGIGTATRARLEKEGHTVIGVDVRDAEVIADLSTPAGRDSMVAGVTKACGGSLDGLIAGAGISSEDAPLMISINYFGAVATLAGLRPLLAKGTNASAVAISSNSTTAPLGSVVPAAVTRTRPPRPWGSGGRPGADASPDGDEQGAPPAVGEGFPGYATAKLA